MCELTVPTNFEEKEIKQSVVTFHSDVRFQN